MWGLWAKWIRLPMTWILLIFYVILQTWESWAYLHNNKLSNHNKKSLVLLSIMHSFCIIHAYKVLCINEHPMEIQSATGPHGFDIYFFHGIFFTRLPSPTPKLSSQTAYTYKYILFWTFNYAYVSIFLLWAVQSKASDLLHVFGHFGRHRINEVLFWLISCQIYVGIFSPHSSLEPSQPQDFFGLDVLVM